MSWYNSSVAKARQEDTPKNPVILATCQVIEFKSSQLLEVDGPAAAAGRSSRPRGPRPGTRGGRAAQAVLPSYSKDLEEAVLAFVAYKFAPGMGTSRDGGVATGWKEAATVQADIPNYPAGGYPELPRPDDRRDHRLLRLRPPVLRALPGQHRSVRHRAFSRTLDDRINSAAEETWER